MPIHLLFVPSHQSLLDCDGRTSLQKLHGLDDRIHIWMMLLNSQLKLRERTWESLPRGSALFFAIGFEDDLRLPILTIEVSTAQLMQHFEETCRRVVVVLRKMSKERAIWVKGCPRACIEYWVDHLYLCTAITDFKATVLYPVRSYYWPEWNGAKDLVKDGMGVICVCICWT